MGKSRFYDRQSGECGPVIGAFCPITISCQTAIGNSESLQHCVQLPTGARYRVTDVTAYCGTVTSDPGVSVGSTLGGTEIVNAGALSTGAAQLTVRDYTPAATGIISVYIIADAGDAVALPCTVTLWGYMSEEPTAL